MECNVSRVLNTAHVILMGQLCKKNGTHKWQRKPTMFKNTIEIRECWKL